MTLETARYMTFWSAAKGFSDENLFTVGGYTAYGAISRLYCYTVDLYSNVASFPGILDAPCFLGVTQQAQGGGVIRLKIHGVMDSWERLEKRAYGYHYRARIVPPCKPMGDGQANQIYQNCSIPQIVEAELKQAGLDQNYYDFKINMTPTANNQDMFGNDVPGDRKKQQYPIQSFVSQCRESNLAFVMRHLETEGIPFYFRHEEATSDDAPKEGNAVMVFFDSIDQTDPIPVSYEIPYRPVNKSGTDSVSGDRWFDETHISEISSRIKRIPATYTTNDHNWKDPTKSCVGEYTDFEKAYGASGLFYEYGTPGFNADDNKVYAEIRGEEQFCRQTIIRGKTNSRHFRSSSGLAFQTH